MEQLYKGMLKTIPQNEETSNYTSTIMDYYKDQMIQSVAEQTTAQSSLGLAQMLDEAKLWFGHGFRAGRGECRRHGVNGY